MISHFQPFFSAWCLYIWNRSWAKSAASSPPVPARISMTHRVRLASSPPTVMSKQLAPQLLALAGELRAARPRPALSRPASLAPTSASARQLHRPSALKRRYFVATLASEPCSRATAASLPPRPAPPGRSSAAPALRTGRSCVSSCSRMEGMDRVESRIRRQKHKTEHKYRQAPKSETGNDSHIRGAQAAGTLYRVLNAWSSLKRPAAAQQGLRDGLKDQR